MLVLSDPKRASIRLLVYIPCHVDFYMALDNIARIRRQKEISIEKLGRLKLDVVVILSVNGTDLSADQTNQLRRAADHFIYFKESIGADTNINLGFLKALELQPTYFWILSANDHLVQNAIENIGDLISTSPDSDLFITNSLDRNSTFEICDVFRGNPDGLSTGLISGVIYKFDTMRSSFSAGPRFAWTGWGQLAVIQYGCQIRGSLVVTEIPDNKLYEKPYTYAGNEPFLNEFEIVRKGYAHSFFGMILLIFAVFPRNRKSRNLAIGSWLKKNWFKVSYFKIGTYQKFDRSSPQFDSLWVQDLAIRILRTSGFISRVITEISLFIKVEKFRKISALTVIKKWFSK
jgi:hypothetical protein